MDNKIENIVSEQGYNKELASVLIKLYEYMKVKQWWGACHATASVLYVILKEIGFNPVICIGEVEGADCLFDHSWIELDGKKIDLAVSMTLANGMAVSAPVILDVNIENHQKSKIKYGIKGRGLDKEALFISQCPFDLYMDMFPDDRKGLWGIVENILGKEIDSGIKEKYKNVNRKIVCN